MRIAAHTSRKSWFRLLAVTVVVLCSLYAPNARAAAPMCGPHAETLLAPPVMKPAKDAVLRATPKCDGPVDLLLAAPASPQQEPTTVLPDAPTRALPFLIHFPHQPILARRPAQTEGHTTPSSDVLNAIFRPPRA